MKLTVVSNLAEGGSVTIKPASGDGMYYPHDNVTLTAVASPGYVFVNWTGDVSQIEDPDQATIVVELNRYYEQKSQDLQIFANFARERSFPWLWLGAGLAGGLVVLLALLGVLLYLWRARSLPAA